MPQLHAMLLYGRGRSHGLLDDGLYPLLPFRRLHTAPGRTTELRVVLSWDFSPLVFSSHPPLIGREARTMGALRSQIISEVQQAHRRLRELHVLLATVPARDLRTRLMYRMRIDESRAYLDRLTGGVLQSLAWRTLSAASRRPSWRGPKRFWRCC